MIASFVFFAFGSTDEMLIFIITLVLNYYFGLKIGNTEDSVTSNKWLKYGVILNILILFVFKYFNFFTHNLNSIFNDIIPESKIALPLGISFYTFHNISYLLDISKKKIKAESNFINLALYISFFPQLIAGPIVRYVDVISQVYNRKLSLNLFINGVKRFIIGLGKKVILANTFAGVADRIFDYNLDHFNTYIAWVTVFMYMLQIYYDFSGYSDMAIGLGRMMGFNFKENFNFPYASKSIQEFWRKWHISLSSWFRDYVYIPLGGNRVSTSRGYVNILSVFLLTGIWHGANWNFFIWGISHGILIIAEKTILKKFIDSKYNFLKNIYLLLAVAITWVFFRLENFSDAISLINTMFSFNFCFSCINIGSFVDKWVITCVILACIFMYPQKNIIKQMLKFNLKPFLSIFYIVSYFTIFIISIMSLASGTYNPFIYFRF